jgi:hypothetical protein
MGTSVYTEIPEKAETVISLHPQLDRKWKIITQKINKKLKSQGYCIYKIRYKDSLLQQIDTNYFENHLKNTYEKKGWKVYTEKAFAIPFWTYKMYNVLIINVHSN